MAEDKTLAAMGAALRRLLGDAKKEREDYDKEAKELDEFAYNSKYKFNFEGSSVTFESRISKVSQAIEIMGAHLDDPTPQRIVTPRKRAPQDVIDRCKIEEELLNHLVPVTGLVAQTRMARTQAIAHGCGVMWTGIHPKTGLPQTVYDDDCNLYQDPYARNVLQRKMCFRKREKPRWQVMQDYAKDERTMAIIGELTAVEDGQSTDRVTDIVCYYEGYFTDGLHHYMTDAVTPTDEAGNPVDPTDDPVKYIFTDDGKLIAQKTWELPFHRDNRWPYELLTFRDKPGCLWPPSILATGLGHIKALNFFYTYFLKRFRFSYRMMLGLANINGASLSAEDKANLLDISEDSPVATLNLEGMNDGKKFSDFVQELNLDPRVQSFAEAYQLIERQFEQETGLYEFLHYGSGETQDRTAAATQARSAATKTRIEDMRVRYTDWQSSIARQEAIASRHVLNQKEIRVIFDDQVAAIWGTVAPPAMIQQQQQMIDGYQKYIDQAAVLGMTQPPPLPQMPVLIDFDQWLKEANHTIETSYARRKDLDQRIDSMQELNNQVNPQLLQSADPNERAMAFDNMAMLFDARGVPDELVSKYREHADQLRQQAIIMQQQQAAMAQQQMAMGQPPGQPQQEPAQPQGPQ